MKSLLRKRLRVFAACLCVLAVHSVAAEEFWGVHRQKDCGLPTLPDDYCVKPLPSRTRCAAGCDDYGAATVKDWRARFSREWPRTAELFVAADGWRNKADDERNNNFGFRLGFNSSFGHRDIPLRGQFGMSYGGYDLHGRDQGDELSSIEQQLFFTAGGYMPPDYDVGRRFSFSTVVDGLYDENFGEEADEVFLTQFRFHAGRLLSPADEVGIWGAARLSGDMTKSLGGGVSVRTINQLSLFWRHAWQAGAVTMPYLGLADEPADMVFGFHGEALIGKYLGLFGEFAYFLPSTGGGDLGRNGVDNSFAEETWNVSVGFVLHTRQIGTTSPSAPFLPSASNATLPVRVPNGPL